MDQQQLEKVFDGKLDNTRNIESKRLNPYGNGIGLALCKEICQSLDGTISASSEFGIGSTFTFTMKVFSVLLIQHDATVSWIMLTISLQQHFEIKN